MGDLRYRPNVVDAVEAFKASERKTTGRRQKGPTRRRPSQRNRVGSLGDRCRQNGTTTQSQRIRAMGVGERSWRFATNPTTTKRSHTTRAKGSERTRQRSTNRWCRVRSVGAEHGGRWGAFPWGGEPWVGCFGRSEIPKRSRARQVLLHSIRFGALRDWVLVHPRFWRVVLFRDRCGQQR